MDRLLALVEKLVVGKSTAEIRRLAGLLSDKGPHVIIPADIAVLLESEGVQNRSTRAILAQVLAALADFADFSGDCPNTRVA